MICPHGDMTVIGHNEILDITAEWLSRVCNVSEKEPQLQPITGESIFPKSANKKEEARSDIKAKGFCGGLGKESTVAYKRIAELLAIKRKSEYGATLAWMRCRLSFALLRSAIACILDRGHAINICPTREVTASSGQIRSPNYPSNYPASTDCTLTIKQPLDTNFIFTFIMLDMESPFVDGCRYDELIISGSLSKKLCGTNTPAPFVIDVNVVTLRMVTDGSVEQSGFDLKFNTSRTTGLPPAVSVCPTRTITPRATGRVHSPGFAGNYGANLNCKLTLNVLSNKDVEISYNYRDIENASQCSKDKLTVADNSASNYTCGVSSAGNTTTYRDGNVSFLFSTDGSGSGSGFILTYKLLNKSPVSNQSTSAGQPTQPSSTTESTTKHSSTTDEIIQPFSTTKRNIQPFSTTGGTTQHFFTTESTILPSSTTDGNTQSSFTTEGTAQTSSTTDGTTQHSSTTEGTTLPSSSTEGTAQPSSTTENFRPVECLSVDSETEDKKIRMHLLIPLVILALCFLLSLAVIIYQSRRLQNSNRRASRRGILGGQELSNYMIMKGDSEAGDD
ncbi:tolloid 2 [Paramuricea clavata]|uniref:Tolloid 2 n=1 Tax=Paramuricea clavata TaxID=317549 RepID=A0A6S7G6T1_PARCT|nr:tolloid 2 [Paramuricea clavata]